MKRLPPFLLGLSAALQVIGATIHALGLTKVQSKFDGSALSPFLIGASKALWLSESAYLMVIGALFAAVAAQPGLVSPVGIMVLSLGPLAAATLIYSYVGAFFAGHLMASAAALGVAAAGVTAYNQSLVSRGPTS